MLIPCPNGYSQDRYVPASWRSTHDNPDRPVLSFSAETGPSRGRRKFCAAVGRSISRRSTSLGYPLRPSHVHSGTPVTIQAPPECIFHGGGLVSATRRRSLCLPAGQTAVSSPPLECRVVAGAFLPGLQPLWPSHFGRFLGIESGWFALPIVPFSSATWQCPRYSIDRPSSARSRYVTSKPRGRATVLFEPRCLTSI